MRSTSFGVLVCVLLAACGPAVQRMALQDDANAKAFPPPAPSASAVYIYRSGGYAPHWPVDVKLLGDHVQTPLPVDTFVRAEVPAGLTEVSCITNALPDRHRLDLQPDQTRYFRVTIEAGSWGPFCLVAEVPAEEGQAAVLRTRRIPRLYP
jgi:hypothetical protein